MLQKKDKISKTSLSVQKSPEKPRTGQIQNNNDQRINRE